jgi:hypothetical protein
MATASRCPQCHAPLDPRKDRCAYCGSWLVLPAVQPEPESTAVEDYILEQERHERWVNRLGFVSAWVGFPALMAGLVVWLHGAI